MYVSDWLGQDGIFIIVKYTRFPNFFYILICNGQQKLCHNTQNINQQVS